MKRFSFIAFERLGHRQDSRRLGGETGEPRGSSLPVCQMYRGFASSAVCAASTSNKGASGGSRRSSSSGQHLQGSPLSAALRPPGVPSPTPASPPMATEAASR